MTSLREQLARALADNAGSCAFRASGRVWDHERAVWYRVADALLATLSEGMAQLRQQIADAEQRAEQAESTIARVRAIADATWGGDDHEDIRRDIRTALQEPTP
ncbi:hypothetical protein [Streptomyces jumonjinensis]|uniref:Uncharacterized protein n=1 Tax=Streptomyces jumonjinensis TaxID=1945 RepID=A0A646KP80_STRJU|nr:hypothetical protein [Streptomyces jumonjinensis]MQT03878.1 hypothetical protein [Streptomyces jumonjinensis]